MGLFSNSVKNGGEHHMVHITISEVKNGVYHQTNKRTSLLWGREVGLLFFSVGVILLFNQFCEIVIDIKNHRCYNQLI